MAYIQKHKNLYSYFLIVIGTAIMAFGIGCFYEPLGLVTGGFSGLAIIVKEVTGTLYENGILLWYEDGGIPLWFTNLALNIPVFILAYFLKGSKFIGKTLFGTIMLSVWLYLLPVWDFADGDMLIGAIFGGVCAGLGIGLVIKVGATTGGTDMVAALIQLKVRHYSVVQILQVIDGAVVLLGFTVFGIGPTLYAIIGIVVQTKVADLVVEGSNYSKAAYIISDKHEIVAEKILNDLDRGLTGLEAHGMYTKTEKRVLMCVVTQKELVVLKNPVHEVDPNAFVIVSDVREVLGEGFQEYKKEF